MQRILANPVYSQISGSLAGAQEYAAMAKLHDFDREGGYDTIIVDTPPTAHALDFLDAPRKLSEAIDSPAIEWFRKLQGGSGSGWSLVGKTGSFVMKRLAKFVGSQFIDDLGVFFTEFNDILGGFRTARRGDVRAAPPAARRLRAGRVARGDGGARGAVLPRALGRREDAVRRLRRQQGPPAAADHRATSPRSRRRSVRSQASRRSASRARPTRWPRRRCSTAHGEIEVLAKADRVAIGKLQQAGGDASLLIEVPLLRDDVHEVKSLIGLEQYLLA